MTDTPEDAIPDPDDSDMPGGTVDVLLIGGGIMSATLGTLLQELQPAERRPRGREHEPREPEDDSFTDPLTAPITLLTTAEEARARRRIPMQP